jgi:Family of unknown function (DUF6516)
MAKRSRPQDELDPRKSVRDEFYPKGRKLGVVVRIQADYSRKGRLLKYSMALIDTQNIAIDNGRLLGYDHAHGYHHRHRLGQVEPVEFDTYEDTEKRFEAEVRKYLETGEL